MENDVFRACQLLSFEKEFGDLVFLRHHVPRENQRGRADRASWSAQERSVEDVGLDDVRLDDVRRLLGTNC